MTRFVELPSVSERGATIWVNPDHVVSVETSWQEGRSWLMTEMGNRHHIALSPAAVVECLDDYWADSPDGVAIDLRDSVRENLTR